MNTKNHDKDNRIKQVSFYIYVLTFLLNKKYAPTSRIHRAIMQTVTMIVKVWETVYEYSSSIFVPIVFDNNECLCLIFTSKIQ